MNETPESPAPEFAFCLRCGYPLRGLSGPACPECGRKFDPRKRHTFGPLAHRGGISRHDKVFGLAAVYGAGLVIGLLTLLVSRHFAWLLIPVLAVLVMLMLARVAPSDVCDQCGREFRRGIPEKCPACRADMGTDRKRYGF